METALAKAAFSVLTMAFGMIVYEKCGFHVNYHRRCIEPIAKNINSYIDTDIYRKSVKSVLFNYRFLLYWAIGVAIVVTLFAPQYGCAFFAGYIVRRIGHRDDFLFDIDNCDNLYQIFQPYIHPGKEDLVLSYLNSVFLDSATEKTEERPLNNRRHTATVITTLCILFCVTVSAVVWYNTSPSSNTSTSPNSVSMPASGTILAGREYYNGSELTISASSSSSCVVSLKNANGVERVCFFVRAGETVTIKVPQEYLYAYFASGTKWYGYGKGLMFGENTSYTKDDGVLNFRSYTYQYTLYPVAGGNFSQSKSNQSEFFD